MSRGWLSRQPMKCFEGRVLGLYPTVAPMAKVPGDKTDLFGWSLPLGLHCSPGSRAALWPSYLSWPGGGANPAGTAHTCAGLGLPSYVSDLLEPFPSTPPPPLRGPCNGQKSKVRSGQVRSPVLIPIHLERIPTSGN